MTNVMEERSSKKGNFNLPDLKQLKLSDEDALALSYLTPGLSRRIQKQLLAQLAPSEARKLSRTLSSRSSSESKTNYGKPDRYCDSERKSVDRTFSSLPRRYSTESSSLRHANNQPGRSDRENSLSKLCTNEKPFEALKPSRDSRETSSKINSFLPAKSPSRDYNSPHAEYSAFDNFVDTKNGSKSSQSEEQKVDIPSQEEIYSSASESSKHDCKPYKNASRIGKYLCSPYSDSSHAFDSDLSKSDTSSSSSSRRISRFLRPDFFENKEANYYLKEKKEREMETQKVLKEIRDKRKGRLRDRSASREGIRGELQANDDKCINNVENCSDTKSAICSAELTDNLLKNVSDTIKNLESNVKGIHDYVNVPNEFDLKNDDSTIKIEEPVAASCVVVNEQQKPFVKKERISKIVRPKSYPTDSRDIKETSSKISELTKKDTTKSKTNKSTNGDKVKNHEQAKDSNGGKQSCKKKFFQTIEKKFEKIRAFSNSPNDESHRVEDKRSSVEDTIRRLREQSLPRTTDHCITESGLIKRAVSVEDLTTLGTAADSTQLQPSRKSVTKILNLFKKYEEKDNKKVEKVTNPKKSKDESKKSKDGSKKLNKNKSKLDTENTDLTHDTRMIGAESVMSNNNNKLVTNKSDINLTHLDLQKTINGTENVIKPVMTDNKAARPRSLLFDRVKKFQNSYTGTRSDSSIPDVKDPKLKSKSSKLPITSFRRSLNLENTNLDPPNFYRNSNPDGVINNFEDQQPSERLQEIDPGVQYYETDLRRQKRADRSGLKLDLSKKTLHKPESQTLLEPSDPTRNGNTLQDHSPRDGRYSTESSALFSPSEDNSCDSWSICSDFPMQDVTSPVSPGNHFYSADENDSVSDRIRRKSFYPRFNEKKRPRKTNYKDLDLYRELNHRKSSHKSREPSVDRSSRYNASANDYTHYSQDPYLLHDGYVNVPIKYPTYSPRITRRSSSLYVPDSEENNSLDDPIATGESRMHSYNAQPSKHSKKSVSPING